MSSNSFKNEVITRLLIISIYKQELALNINYF